MPTLHFGGCGLLSLYHIGVAKALVEIHVDISKLKENYDIVSGTSGGVLISSGLMFNIHPDDMLKIYISMVLNKPSNPFKICSTAQEVSEKFKLENSVEFFKESSNKCQVYLSKYKFPLSLKGVTVDCDDLDSDEELLDLWRASYHVPLLGGGISRKWRDGHYLDGISYSNQLNKEDLLISPFWYTKYIRKGQCITPSIDFPALWGFFPPQDKIAMLLIHKLGYYDCLNHFDKCGNYEDYYEVQYRLQEYAGYQNQRLYFKLMLAVSIYYYLKNRRNPRELIQNCLRVL